jgi:hypothetical protein
MKLSQKTGLVLLALAAGLTITAAADADPLADKRAALAAQELLIEDGAGGPHLPDPADENWDDRWQFVACRADFQSGLRSRGIDYPSCSRCEADNVLDADRVCAWLCYGYRPVTESERRWYPEGYKADLALVAQCADMRDSAVHSRGE